jgi:hypothetical protein
MAAVLVTLGRYGEALPALEQAARHYQSAHDLEGVGGSRRL